MPTKKCENPECKDFYKACDVIKKLSEEDSEPSQEKEVECPKSKRVDGKLHSWKFDGDDPYVICVFCGKREDALTGKEIPQKPAEEEKCFAQFF